MLQPLPAVVSLLSSLLILGIRHVGFLLVLRSKLGAIGLALWPCTTLYLRVHLQGREIDYQVVHEHDDHPTPPHFLAFLKLQALLSENASVFVFFLFFKRGQDDQTC